MAKFRDVKTPQKFASAVISENSDSRSCLGTRGANLSCICGLLWWRRLDGLVNRSETGGRRSTSAQSMGVGRSEAQAEADCGSAWVVGYATKRSYR